MRLMLNSCERGVDMKSARELWLNLIGNPTVYAFEHTLALKKTYVFENYYVELYDQANGPGTAQRLMMAFPKNATEPIPCVAVPFYFPEAMLGFDTVTGDILERYKGIEIMLHLVRRGYIVASAEAYHLTYINSEKEREDFFFY